MQPVVVSNKRVSHLSNIGCYKYLKVQDIFAGTFELPLKLFNAYKLSLRMFISVPYLLAAASLASNVFGTAIKIQSAESKAAGAIYCNFFRFFWRE